MLIETTRYELPAEGISLLGYVVRRMHKTEWLAKVSSALAESKTAEALKYAAVYAATSSTSFGRAYYQPSFDRAGETISEPDPATGAIVTATLESISPHYHIASQANMPNGDIFKGSETITGTIVGLRGLGMPAPSRFMFASGNYTAEFEGLITSELVLSLFRKTHIRAHGFLNLKDNRGNAGRLELDRNGEISIKINSLPVINHVIAKITWMNVPLPASQPL